MPKNPHAFPQVPVLRNSEVLFPAEWDENEGMELRDWFAGQALLGMCSCQPWPLQDDGPEMSKRAYRFADAMLAEREREPKG